MTRPRTLHLAPGLDIPAEEFIESRTAFIGKSGSGKTGGAKVVEEELFRVGLPFVTFDPVGVHWGIRSSFDGKGPGLPVLVIGGQHGDVRLDRRAGAETCRAIMEANVSAVIDFKGEPKAVYREFVRDFAQELLAHNATSRVVILEEAKELVPQKYRPDMAEVYDAVERLVSQGRNMGIGVVLVGQRPATINKDVLTQIDTMFVGRVIGLPDRQALREWVEAVGTEEKWKEFSASLAELPTRTMWAWSPELLKIFKEVRFNDFKTLHADRTHLRRLGMIEQKITTTDVSGVVAKLGAQLDRLSKEKEDVKRLPAMERELAALRKKLEEAKARPPVAAPTRSKADIEREMHEAVQPFREEVKALRVGLKEANARLAKYKQLAELLGVESAKGPVEVAQITPTQVVRPPPPAPVRPVVRAPVVVAKAPLSPSTGLVEEPNGEAPGLRGGAIRMLKELASRHPITLTYPQLATLAGFTPRGGTALAYRSALFRSGYLQEDRDGSLHVTQTGFDFLRADIPPAPSTHDEVMARWGAVLRKGAYRMLEVVAARYPGAVTDEDLAGTTGFTVSGGTYLAYRGLLIRNGLVEATPEGLRASLALFPEAV